MNRDSSGDTGRDTKERRNWGKRKAGVEGYSHLSPTLMDECSDPNIGDGNSNRVEERKERRRSASER